MKNTEEKSVWFLSEDFMNFEFNYHDFYVCIELIQSDILKINMSILKEFINNRNHFTNEERESLGLRFKVKFC